MWLTKVIGRRQEQEPGGMGGDKHTAALQLCLAPVGCLSEPQELLQHEPQALQKAPSISAHLTINPSPHVVIDLMAGNVGKYDRLLIHVGCVFEIPAVGACDCACHGALAPM